MATFHERIQDYVGEFEYVDALTLWLREAVRKILELIPAERLGPFIVSATFTSGNLTIDDKRVLDVLVGGRRRRGQSPRPDTRWGRRRVNARRRPVTGTAGHESAGA